MNIAGLISSIFFLLTIAGYWHQLRKIWTVKQSATNQIAGGNSELKATQSIDLRFIFSAYISIYSFFAYGLSLPQINPYLVIPRIIAIVIILAIIYEIWQERKNKQSQYYLLTALSVLIAVVVVALISRSTLTALVPLWRLILCALSINLGWGFFHQSKLLTTSGTTGNLSLPMLGLSLAKDISGVVFGATMGFQDGWPVALMHLVSILGRVILIRQYRGFEIS
ncbi:hypothetical protein JNK13_10235 [bacterium]|nr:hypothetical protein [bacterium]